ncbi:Hypothetical predicted protein, partial [Paramuricea clavata]
MLAHAQKRRTGLCWRSKTSEAKPGGRISRRSERRGAVQGSEEVLRPSLGRRISEFVCLLRRNASLKLQNDR